MHSKAQLEESTRTGCAATGPFRLPPQAKTIFLASTLYRPTSTTGNERWSSLWDPIASEPS